MTFKELKNSIAGALDSSSLVCEAGFSRSASDLSWGRCVDDVCQIFLIEKMKSDNLRVRAFIFDCDDISFSIGGNVTRASVKGSDDFGADWYWSIGTKEQLDASVDDIILTLRRVVLPWFSVVKGMSVLRSVAARFPNAQCYQLSQDVVPPKLDTIPSHNLDLGLIQISPSEFQMFIAERLESFFHSKGFKRVEGERLSYVRCRGEVHDVFILELINYGLALGAYAFNWVNPMALDGSGVYSNDFAFLLNGGAISDSGQRGVDSGVGFILDNESQDLISLKDFINIAERIVLPNLENVKSLDDFVSSIRPDMALMAKKLGLIK